MHPERPLPSEPRTPDWVCCTIPDGLPVWITPQLVHLTLKVWQRYYAETLSNDDAVTILLNAGRLLSALSRE
jgi:hypothetical protein